MPVRDATAGFRVFRREVLEAIDLSSVQSAGYVFQTDLAHRTLRPGSGSSRCRSSSWSASAGTPR